MAAYQNGTPREALTFDDVLLTPGPSDVMPSEVDTKTRITGAIGLNIPVIASVTVPGGGTCFSCRRRP